MINVGVSGPGVVQRRAGQACAKDADLDEVAEAIKAHRLQDHAHGPAGGAARPRTRLGVPFGIVDLSLAPTPAVGDSVAEILEAMGLETCGAPGTTAALALLNDAVKKGGVMASLQRRRPVRRVHPRVRGRRHDRRRRVRRAVPGEAGGHDLRLLRGPGHDRHPRRHPGGDHLRHHRRRSAPSA